MGKFLRGLLFGMGLGLLVAPMRGQDLRRLLSERFQNLRGYLPENVQLPENTQQDTSPDIQKSRNAKSATTTTQPLPRIQSPLSEVSTTSSARASQPSPMVSLQEVTPSQSEQRPPSTQSPQHDTSSTSISASSADLVEKNAASTELLSRIPGIEPAMQRTLEAEGIRTVSQLLNRTSTKEERGDLAQKVGMNTHTLKTIANRADLMRLEGVGPDVVLLLDEAGVNGCKDLQRRNPEHLQATLAETESRKRIVSRALSLTEITEWIGEAMEVAATAVDE